MVVELLLLILTITSTVRPAPVINEGCPKECDCIGTRINCDNRNLTSVPESTNIDNNFTDINLSNNFIKHLDSEEFYSYSKLKRIIITNSTVEKIDSYAFSYLKDLKEIRLDKNAIEHLDLRVFDSIPNLERLDLSSNPLNFETGTKFPDSLKFLALRRCHLKILPGDVIDDLDQLETLDLGHNNLPKIPRVIFKLGKVTRIYLDGNPLLCDDVEKLLLRNQPLIVGHKKVRCFGSDDKERMLPWRVLSQHAQDASSGEGVAITSSSKGKMKTSTTARPQHSDSVPAYHSDGGRSSTTSGTTSREPPVAAVENVTSQISQPPGEKGSALGTWSIVGIIGGIIVAILIFALGWLYYRNRQPALNSFLRVPSDANIL